MPNIIRNDKPYFLGQMRKNISKCRLPKCYLLNIKFLSGFLSKVNADVKSAYACSDTSSGVGNDCILFNISCKSDKRIQIHSALYGFRVSNPDKCKTDNGKCRKDNGCCFAASGDKKTIFSQLHIYNVYRACSWNSSCISQAPFGHDSGGSSKYSVLKYNCVKGMVICQFFFFLLIDVFFCILYTRLYNMHVCMCMACICQDIF